VGVVNQIALRKGVVPRGNELHGEGRSLYARFSTQRRRSAPNSLIVVPCRARAGKKTEKVEHAAAYPNDAYVRN